MPSRSSFKSDESFLEKIAMGAIGTQRVYKDLVFQGYKPLELERGSMGYKIWKRIKIKRIRVPDLLCVDTGRRIESRAKSKMELTMSHSTAEPERSWEYGLDDDDFVALIVCHKTGEKPTDWTAEDKVQYIRVGDLRKAEREGFAKIERPKGVEEGFETRITWPSVICSTTGSIISLIPGEKIQYKSQESGRTITLRLNRGRTRLNALVQVSDIVTKNQVLASVVPITQTVPRTNPVGVDYYLMHLQSPSQSKRYASAKALRLFNSPVVHEALNTKISQDDEHIYVRLESAASLARQNQPTGLSFIRACLQDTFPQHRLEAVIVLGEIGSQEAKVALIETLSDKQQHPEIRAGAAWALGELRDKDAMSCLINSFIETDEEIKIEAARALAKIARIFTAEVIQTLPENPPEIRPGIAWAISKAGKFSVSEMLNALIDDDARQWSAYVIGSQDEQDFLSEIEQLRTKDPEVYFAVTVLWKVMSSWVYNLDEIL